MTHGDTVRDGDRAELARRAISFLDAIGNCMGLAHQRGVAGGRFIPARGDAYEGLLDVLGRQAHCVIIAALRRACGAFGDVSGGKA